MTLLGILQQCETANLVLPPCPAGTEAIRFLTAWRIDGPLPRPYRLFLHMLDERGTILTQHDGLDVATAMLRAGDVVLQLHQLPAPDVGSQAQWLEIGVYEPETGARPAARTADGENIERVMVGPLQ